MRTHLPLLSLAFASACLLSCSTSNPAPPIDVGGGGGSSGSGSGSGSGNGSGSSSGGAIVTDASGGDGAILVPTGGFGVTGILEDGETLTAIPGASICLFTAANECVVSTSTGAFTINGLTATGSGITGAQDGYVTGIWSLSPTSSINSFKVFLRTPARMSELATEVTSTFSLSGAGVIHFIAYAASGDPLAGVTVSTSAGGTTGYFDKTGATLSNAVPETTPDGAGMIFGLTPSAQVDVTFTSPGKTCVHYDSSGWAPKSSTATMSVPVVAGAVTSAWATCT